MSDVVLEAKGLVANGSEGRVFGPLDLTAHGGELVVVSGPRGSGKSSLLLALSGRLAHTKGELYVDGVDAIAHPYKAMQKAGVARLGDYVESEDRLTLEESLYERCFLDDVSYRDARRRVDQMCEAVGVKVDMSLLMEDLDVIERAVVTMGLVLLRPTRVTVFDDVDAGVPHRDKPMLYNRLRQLLEIDDGALICNATDPDGAPEGSLLIELPSNHMELTAPDVQMGRKGHGDLLAQHARHAQPSPGTDATTTAQATPPTGQGTRSADQDGLDPFFRES